MSSAKTALERSPGRWAPPLLVAALVLATFAALYSNQRVRRQGLVLDSIHVTSTFSPDGDGHHDRARISFRVKGPDQIDLTMIDANGRPIRRLATDRLLADRQITVFRWDGRTDAGRPAPPGAYTLRVEELRRGRTITPSEQITLLAPGAK
ncbi:MAG: FlgD immunoglobulin-like domain containing protein [Solirubrobacterales bacterium]